MKRNTRLRSVNAKRRQQRHADAFAVGGRSLC